MAKIIRSFIIETKNISANGEVRSFKVVGDKNAVFTLQVTNEDSPAAYYNFETKTFTTTRKTLQVVIDGSGQYNGSIKFPSVGDADHYDIFLFAESAYNTKHAPYVEVRKEDGTININATTGSESNLLKRKIIQPVNSVLTISAVSPNHNTEFASLTKSSVTITGTKNNSSIKVPFTLTITTGGANALAINKNPSINDIAAYKQIAMGTGQQYDSENLFAGSTRTTNKTVDGAVTSGVNVTMDDNVADIMTVGDRVTGNPDLDGKTGDKAVTVAAINVGSDAKVFAMSEAIAISDGETLDFTPPRYRRYYMSDVIGLHSGTVLVGSTTSINGELETGTTISAYSESVDVISSQNRSYTEIIDGKMTTINLPPKTETIKEITDSFLAVDRTGYESINRTIDDDGIVTRGAGIITLNNSTSKDLEGDNVNFYGYGNEGIKHIIDYDIEFTNLKATLTELTTTTTSASTASTTVNVADRSGFMNKVTKIKGIGIDSSSEYPLVTAGAGSDGAGALTLSSAQTLENGTTLTLLGTGSVVTITGNVEVKKFGPESKTIYFDVERFLTGS